MNILETIVQQKRTEVTLQKESRTIAELEGLPLFSVPSYSLKRFLLDPSRTGIIAEFKRRSPSKGVLNERSSVTEVTTGYATNGATAISILTDKEFFGGSLDDLVTARIQTVPLLRKEFIIDEYQITEARAYGADAILLIAAILTPQQVKDFTRHAHSLGLEVILELHDESELDHLTAPVDVIGINNRNLKTFEVDLEQSVRLASRLPADALKISESGLHKPEDLRYLKGAGYNGFLIGENFMKEPDPGLAFARFVTALNETP